MNSLYEAYDWFRIFNNVLRQIENECNVLANLERSLYITKQFIPYQRQII